MYGDTSPAMSQSNVDRVRAVFDIVSDPGALELLKAGKAPVESFYAPDVVMDLGDFDVPGLDRQYRGLEGARRAWMDWLAPWEELRVDVEYFERDDYVVAVIDQRQRGVESGVEVSFRYAQLFRFRDRRVVFWQLYRNPPDALAAAGIEADLAT